MKTCLMLICILFMFGYHRNGNIIAVNELYRKKIPQSKDTKGQDKAYSWLTFEDSFVLPASSGVKSVIFNSSGTKLYALSLEGMSIYEFGQENKKLLRIFDFKPTKAQGWNYALNIPIAASFAEKPVEACFSHQDKIMWVSLHNAGGIVPVLLDSLLMKKSRDSVAHCKVVYVKNLESLTTDTQYISLIKTGVMPKVIARTADNEALLVSNWGSKSLSIIKINDTLFPYGKRLATIKLPEVPRGIAVDDKHKKSYVAIYGDSRISVIRHKNWKVENNLAVPFNPRHLVLDTTGRLFVSFNAISQIACIETGAGKVLFKANTHSQPRTIALSKNQKFIFVTCYEGNTIDIFKINTNSFTRIYSIKCAGKPVGISLFEDHDKVEAWVGNYMAGNLKVFQFKKQ
jgi:DNA-binding beta-propeller fold protein YncE